MKRVDYLEKNLLQLLEIKKWQQAGVSLERIRDSG
jgi:DNA-binding transcriptional MerR regulator